MEANPIFNSAHEKIPFDARRVIRYDVAFLFGRPRAGRRALFLQLESLTMKNRLTALPASLLAAVFLLADHAAAQSDPLFRVITVNGKCQAVRPTLETAEPVSPKMYPLGTTLRLDAGAEMMFSHQNNFTFNLSGPAEVLVAAGGDGAVLQLVVALGKIRAAFVQSVNYGDVLIDAPGFSCMPGPECHMILDVSREPGGIMAAAVTLDRGEARIAGPHFSLPVLKSCALRIQSALDRSLTRITGVLGEFPAQVDGSGELPMEFTMKPNATIKISRRFAPVTGREGVSVLIINELGVGHASYSFIPGDPTLATSVVLRKPPAEPVEEEGGDAAPAPEPQYDDEPGYDDFQY
jgi:hypothetical protein